MSNIYEKKNIMDTIKHFCTTPLQNNLILSYSSYDTITKEGITKIINKYIKKEKFEYDIFNLEEKLKERYNKDKSNNFSFPEIKNVLDCITDILTYFKNNNYINDDIMCWQINQTINILKNASQETICVNIQINNCPPKNTISTINNKNIIYNYGKQYCDDNVYKTPFNGNKYPYAYCIRVAIESLNMIDLINIDLKNKKNKNIWKSNYTNVYNKKKYHYYLDYLLDNAPDVFLLPILQNIDATFFIKNRYSRIQPCRIIFDDASIFENKDIQTPCNIFWHDINHARKILQNNLWYSKQKNITIDELYANMRIDVNMLIPINNWLSIKDKEYENLIKILLFEIVYEYTLPFTKDIIIDEILFKSNNCFPYEISYDNYDNYNNRFNLRFYEQKTSILRTIYKKIINTFNITKSEFDIKTLVKKIIYASYLLLNKINPKKYKENNKELKILIRDIIYQRNYTYKNIW
jgi:hypothetical protein